jgi:hypothetical protein
MGIGIGHTDMGRHDQIRFDLIEESLMVRSLAPSSTTRPSLPMSILRDCNDLLNGSIWIKSSGGARSQSRQQGKLMRPSEGTLLTDAYMRTIELSRQQDRLLVATSHKAMN